MALRPLHDKVVVKRNDEKTTSSGIVIPQNAGDKPTQGTVVAVGPGKFDDGGTLREVSVKAGDVVVFREYGGSEVRVNGEDLLVISDHDLLGVLE